MMIAKICKLQKIVKHIHRYNAIAEKTDSELLLLMLFMTVVEEKEEKNFEENKMRDIRERFSRGGIFERGRQRRGAEMYIYLKSLGKPFSYHYN
jgi:hypothetical protein